MHNKETNRLFTDKSAYHSSRFESLRRDSNFGKVSFIITQLKLESCRYNQDPPLTCKGMDETCKDETCKEKIENLDESSNNKRTNDAKNLQDDKDDKRAKLEEIILSADICTHQSTRTVPLLNCRGSKEISSKLSNLNSGIL